jgi:hypothetical protein
MYKPFEYKAQLFSYSVIQFIAPPEIENEMSECRSCAYDLQKL